MISAVRISAAPPSIAGARHRKGLPKAIAEGTLVIRDLDLPCAVLNDAENTRILTQNSFLRAIGRHPVVVQFGGGCHAATPNASHSSSTFTISDISQSLGVTPAAIAGVIRKV